MLWPQKIPFIRSKSDSRIKAPALAGFRSTPPRFTSRLSSMGVTTKLALCARSSTFILSPMSVATAIMAVLMLMPSAIANSANALRRVWRRKDSNRGRTNIGLPREYLCLLPQIIRGDHDGITHSFCFEWNRITSARLAHALRIDGRSTVLAGNSGGAFVETDRAADQAGIIDRGYLAVGFAIKQKPYLCAFHHGAVAVQVAVRNRRVGNNDLTVRERDISRRRKRRSGPLVNESGSN